MAVVGLRREVVMTVAAINLQPSDKARIDQRVQGVVDRSP